MPLMVDNTGAYIPPGRTKRELIVENFYTEAAISSHLTVVGTKTLNSISSGRGAYRVATTAVTGNAASLTLGAAGSAVWSASAAGVLFEMNGLSYSSNNITLELGIGDGSPHGAKLIQRPGEVTASVVMNGVETPIKYQLLHNDLVGDTWNIALLLIPERRELHILESGEVAYSFTGAGYSHFRLAPLLRLTTAADSVQFFDISQVKWTAYHA